MNQIKNNVTPELFSDLPGEASISGWADVAKVVERFQRVHDLPMPASEQEFLEMASRGTAFLTFDFGIDGVSIEIGKYARALERFYQSFGESKLHFIAGDFYPQSKRIIKDRWSRFRIEGTNGWQKWDSGQWFRALYHEPMPDGSQRSVDCAREIYRQALRISTELGHYLIDNNIILLIPVNVSSNPGNLALALALVIVTETLGTVVINSNHDFYWDGGKSTADRGPEEEPGARDHFFRNGDNKPFFSLFRRLYPWNGARWLQVNINIIQSEKMIRDQGFPENQVREITTSVSEKLFEDYAEEDVNSARLRMTRILSGGQAKIHPFSLEAHYETLDDWMKEQRPRVIGARDGLELDITSDGIIYLLQPTRVIGRKRIEKGVELILALLQGSMKEAFQEDHPPQLVLHVSGPTPLEHQADLETVLQAYRNLLHTLPPGTADRVFLAFSSGQETHLSFGELDFEDLNIVDIYRLATVVLFPSEDEGRGLPIIESAAVGIPIICSRYRPEAVFAGVIGEGLPKEERIRYLPFPEDEFSIEFLDQAAELLLHPENFVEWHAHNRRAIRQRYSSTALRSAFQQLLLCAYKIAA